MKKLGLAIIALVLVMGIGTSVYAASTDKGESFFERMLPIAKQMHPDLTDAQIKDMADNCQKNNGTGTGSMMNNSSNRGSMMNNSKNRSNMMNF
ncbi:FAD/FMN-containing dehydrogenase [Paenibacillus sp. 19GGS1-52]|uniref:FAD/FMN-containing dehydrogenase n=1 Tax=Paenibacillus sp. 19GGS1-52 TaxID=2758563 RepID=UPI001EFA9BD7|nr:FAD/FMN-containing dehydrogenase [Paenibacillus sp. 19GGS1-52]ULO08580.1 FAD/FMN-containing dehydrogenase [Paenibacillus sp. 19GGS1-52]